MTLQAADINHTDFYILFNSGYLLGRRESSNLLPHAKEKKKNGSHTAPAQMKAEHA